MIRILVVDDDPQIVRVVRLNLSVRGYTVSAASTGRKAVAEAAEVRPDVVVLDLGLPDVDGVDVVADLRRWTSVPIVVLSGRAGSSDKVEALEAGADDYVTKPFDIDELVARIRAVTRRAIRPAAAGPIGSVIASSTLITGSSPASTSPPQPGPRRTPHRVASKRCI